MGRGVPGKKRFGQVCVQAINEFNKAIELDPKCSYAFENRGLSKIKLNLRESATLDFAAALQLEPEFTNTKDRNAIASAYYNKGLNKEKLNDYSGAIRCYDISIEIVTQNPNSYFNRGFCKLLLNNTESACEDLVKAKKLGSQRADDLIKENCR
jgi:tetratricopeptide (TPR) repeat protein